MNKQSVVDLSKARNKKQKKELLDKSEKIIKDLEMVKYIMALAIEGLSYYSKYAFATECISVLNNNKVLLDIHLNKYKKAVNTLEEEMKNELEKTDPKNT
jgi:hypothetical protein